MVRCAGKRLGIVGLRVLVDEMPTLWALLVMPMAHSMPVSASAEEVREAVVDDGRQVVYARAPHLLRPAQVDEAVLPQIAFRLGEALRCTMSLISLPDASYFQGSADACPSPLRARGHRAADHTAHVAQVLFRERPVLRQRHPLDELL